MIMLETQVLDQTTDTVTGRSEMEAEIIEETLADGTIVQQEEPVIESIRKHNSDGSVEVIAVPPQISLGRKKHSGIKKDQFIQIWNRTDILTIKDFCNATGLTENCARVRSYQYIQRGEMLKKLASK